MARRRTRGAAPKRAKDNIAASRTFDQAFGNIDKMEQAVCYRAVTRGYDINAVCEYLWPADVINVLRAAYHFADESRSNTMYFDPEVGVNGVQLNLSINTDAAHLVTPMRGLIKPQDERGPSVVMEDLYVLNETHRKFNRVRAVVNWLNDHATPMAARYYFPPLGALLPIEHRFHSQNGLKSAGCRGNIAEIADDMRASATIIATGLLCEPDKIQNDARLFKVHIITTTGSSNEFALI